MFVLIYMLNILDLIATMILVRRFGIQIEANPFGKWLIETNLVYFVKVFIVGAALLMLWKLRENKLVKIVSIVLLVVYSILIIYHIIIIIVIL